MLDGVVALFVAGTKPLVWIYHQQLPDEALSFLVETVLKGVVQLFNLFENHPICKIKKLSMRWRNIFNFPEGHGKMA